jgi:cellulose biosynthesis protein BcsQ
MIKLSGEKMRKICFYIQKGGVGKTSITGNVADAVARWGRKTLLIDCDPQANTTSWLCPGKPSHDLTEVLTEKAQVADALIEIGENFYLLPVVGIGGTLKKWSETELVNKPRAFDFLCDDIVRLGFDVALFDCSPSLSQLERAILAVADEVVIPLSPEFFSVDGIETFTYELEKIERANRRRITCDKIVVNMLNKSFVRHREFYDALQKLNYQLFTVPQDSKIAESQIAHQRLYTYAKSAKTVPAFEALAQALSGN